MKKTIEELNQELIQALDKAVEIMEKYLPKEVIEKTKIDKIVKSYEEEK